MVDYALHVQPQVAAELRSAVLRATCGAKTRRWRDEVAQELHLMLLEQPLRQPASELADTAAVRAWARRKAQDAVRRVLPAEERERNRARKRRSRGREALTADERRCVALRRAEINARRAAARQLVEDLLESGRLQRKQVVLWGVTLPVWGRDE